MIRTVGLAAHLARRDRGLLVAMLGLGTVFVTILALATVSASRISADHRARSDAIAPRVDLTAAATSDARLRMVDPSVADDRRWGGAQIARQYYVAGASRLVPPGVPRTPAPDEYYASPALIRLIRSDGTIGALFETRRLVGRIAESGLTQPHELRAIEGISSDVPLLVNVNGFGTSKSGATTPPSDRSVLNLVVGWFTAALVWLPGVAFLLILIRLYSQRHAGRARSLRLLGLSRLAAFGTHSTEVALVCLPFSAAGCVIYLFLARHVDRIPGTAIGFYNARAPANATTCLAWVVLLMCLIALTSAATLRGMLDGEPLTSNVPRTVGLSRLGTACLAGGSILLAVMPIIVAVGGGTLTGLLWLGCGFVAVGVGLAGPAIVTAVLRRFGDRASAVSTFVGTRLVGGDSTSLRLGSLLAVVIVLMLGGLSFMSILNGGNSHDWNDRLSRHTAVPVVASDILGQLQFAEVRSILPGAGAAQATEVRHAGRPLRIVFADCTDLEKLGGVAPTGCRGVPQWLDVTTADPPRNRAARAGDSIAVFDDAVDAPATDDRVMAERMPTELDGALLLPTRFAPASATGTGSSYYLVASTDDFAATLARLSAAAPVVQLDLGDLDRHNPDVQQFPEQVKWLTVGATIGLSFGGLALTATALGASRERRDRLRGLRLLGAGRAHLLRVHLWATTSPVVAMGWLATGAGWLVATSMHNIDDRASVHLASIVTIVGIVTAAGVVIGLVTYREAIRQEE